MARGATALLGLPARASMVLPWSDGRHCPRDWRRRMKTTREKQEERRQAKLDLVREQVQEGSLVIRQMTEEERRRYPPRPAQPKRLR